MSTYSQIYIQAVFAVKGRESLIHPSWEEPLYKYMSGVITNKGQKVLAINGMPDHVHLFMGLKPTCVLSDLIREVKKSSNDFIREKKFTKSRFRWQVGYGAFSYSHSQLGRVIAYVMDQKQHHKKKTFREEYLEFLKSFEINHNERFLFEWVDWPFT